MNKFFMKNSEKKASNAVKEIFLDKLKNAQPTKLLLKILLVVFAVIGIIAVYFLIYIYSENSERESKINSKKITEISQEENSSEEDDSIIINGVDLTEDPLVKKLVFNHYDEDDPIWVEAFTWKEIELPDFKMKIPTCDEENEQCYDFSFSDPSAESYYNNIPDCTMIGELSVSSSYYETVNHIEDYLDEAGIISKIQLPLNSIDLRDSSLRICKIVGSNAKLSPLHYAVNNDSKIAVECDNKDQSEWSLLEGRADTVYLDNDYIKVIEYKPMMCHAEAIPNETPYYLVQFNDNLYGFDGGWAPYKRSVMKEIFKSIEPMSSDSLELTSNVNEQKPTENLYSGYIIEYSWQEAGNEAISFTSEKPKEETILGKTIDSPFDIKYQMDSSGLHMEIIDPEHTLCSDTSLQRDLSKGAENAVLLSTCDPEGNITQTWTVKLIPESERILLPY